LDPLFPVPEGLNPAAKKIPPCNTLPENKYSLVFDERIDGAQLKPYGNRYEVPVEIEKEDSDSEDNVGE
jgi:hypothetical protein